MFLCNELRGSFFRCCYFPTPRPKVIDLLVSRLYVISRVNVSRQRGSYLRFSAK